MHMIAYMSEYCGDVDQVDNVIDNIVRVAKLENAKRQITGVLFYLDGKFAQVIEGAEEHLRQLMDNIERDIRHEVVEYLIDTKVENRGFQNWNMDGFDLGAAHIFSKDTMKALTESFKKNLMPKSDSLAFYYKALLAQNVA